MKQAFFHHAFKILKDRCIGCTHCMGSCPTDAIRIRGGKATVLADRCIDCGKCVQACPVSAIVVDQDDFDHIFQYTHRVALIPAVLVGQFPENITEEDILNALFDLGFTHVCEVENAVGLLDHHIDQYLQNYGSETKPLISSFCPAVIRLIQVKFPGLISHIIPLKPPLDVAASYVERSLLDQGATSEEIGIFYVTPCAAKIASVKSPVEGIDSPIQGVININLIYNKIYRKIKQREVKSRDGLHIKPLTPKEMLWSLTYGECANRDGRCLAIDGIHNVIAFLEKIENEEITGIDFLELRACDESCAGGVLAPQNRFLTVERLSKRAQKAPEKHLETRPIDQYLSYLSQNILLPEIKARSMLKLDEDLAKAMEKMTRVNELMKLLPNVDCGICGASNCQAFAEDVVQQRGDLKRCIFIQRDMEQRGEITPEDSIKMMKQVWGKKKFNYQSLNKDQDHEDR